MQGQARLTLKPPWPTFSITRRWLCSVCWQDMARWIEQRAYELDKYDLPIDQVSGWETAGGGLRGTYTER